MAPLVAEVPTAPQLKSRQVYIVDKPDAAQSQIRIGWVGVPRSTADYAALEVLNTILGGSFTSRLNQNLREEHGYSYGASSAFDMRLSAGPFLAAAGVQTDKTGEAVKEFFNELNRIGTLIPDDELKKAKNYVALGFPGEFETTGDLARKLEELVVYNLPDDTFAKFVGAVTSVTARGPAEARGAVHPAGQDGGGGGRRSQGDRRADPPAESRPGELHHHRRTVPIRAGTRCQPSASVPGTIPADKVRCDVGVPDRETA